MHHRQTADTAPGQHTTAVPSLRFPEFENEKPWEFRQLSEVLFEHKEKSTGKEEVYSVSVHKGVVNQIEHLGRNFAATNTENYKRVFFGDIIYTKSPTGSFPFGIIKQSKVHKSVIVSPLYGVFTPETHDLGIILDAYFEYPERTIDYLSSIVQKGAKNTININNETFLSKSLPLPVNKAEQQKIAACLSSLDALIGAADQKLEALKTHKKGLLRQLFPSDSQSVPRLRFPEFAHEGAWEVKRLGELSTFINEKIKLEDISSETYISTENLLPDYAGIIFNSKFPSSGNFTKYQKGDVLFSNIRPYLKKVWLADRDGACSNDVIVIRANSVISNELFSFLLKNDEFINYTMKSAEGVKMPRGDKDSIREYSVKFPKNKAEQQKIAACLSSLDAHIHAQAQRTEALRLHRKGLLQALFPGTTLYSR